MRKQNAIFAPSEEGNIMTPSEMPQESAPAASRLRRATFFTISYIGGALCCAGLCQLVVKAPDGGLPVTFIIDGVSSPESPFVAVQSA